MQQSLAQAQVAEFRGLRAQARNACTEVDRSSFGVVTHTNHAPLCWHLAIYGPHAFMVFSTESEATAKEYAAQLFCERLSEWSPITCLRAM